MDNIRRTKLFDMYNEKRYQEIIDLANKILKNKEKDVYTLLYASDAYIKLEKYGKSIEVLKYILSIDCMNISAKIDLFDILYKTSNYEEAKPLLEEILTFDCEEVKSNKQYFELAKEVIDNYFINKKEKELEFK